MRTIVRGLCFRNKRELAMMMNYDDKNTPSVEKVLVDFDVVKND